MRPKAILIDLDDTLIGTGRPRSELWRETFNLYWEGVSELSINAALSELMTASFEFWSDEDRHRQWRMDLTNARAKVLDVALSDHMKVSDQKKSDLFMEMAVHQEDYQEQATSVLPTARETLIELQSRGYLLAMLTNGAAVPQRAKVTRFDLAQHFDHVQIEGEAGVGKPEPAAYHRAMETLGSSPDDTWIIGDNIEWEVKTPQRLGITAVWRDPHGQGLPEASDAKPHHVIHHMSEVLGLLS